MFFLLWVWSKRVRDALDAFCYFASLFQCATDQCGSGVSLCSGALGKPASVSEAILFYSNHFTFDLCCDHSRKIHQDTTSWDEGLAVDTGVMR